ncbi:MULTISPECIES: hypothetical protein [Asticcacaulis]|uniref:hypothetical protein n=1 Tax=Asticcacaulis TaxID=76890 RepID=UPI001AE5FEA3|nr:MULTISPECIES: hypothetical protein [Asticcacaulis]MBP2159557.1 hypothetical protein [Asticcacaulis solisilvae]MDR6800616.1 hypothetical protein [Asticcacaulis sp. BE141]
MASPEDEAFKLRFFAAVQDKVAALQDRDGLPSVQAKARAHKLRVQVNLIGQGVPAASLKLDAKF